MPEHEKAWLAHRLATLGVDTAADLSLIDNADLIPDLEAETGVPEWVSIPLLDSFPRTVRHQGGTYTCTVSCGTRTVQIEPLDAMAKKLKDPPLGALPRFRGFRVTYKQGSRRFPLR